MILPYMEDSVCAVIQDIACLRGAHMVISMHACASAAREALHNTRSSQRDRCMMGSTLTHKGFAS